VAIRCPFCRADNPDTSFFCGTCAARLIQGGPVPDSHTKTLETTAETLKKGSLIAGKYRIIGEIGRGGMGVVYKAEDQRLGRTVALKFLPIQWTSDPEARERFSKEARAASALDHPNICTVHEIGETDDGRMFITMGCYEGESLREKVKRGPLEYDQAVEIAVQVALGLSKAHQKGIVHRDIKPANILITNDNIVKIVDFGLAKLAGEVRLTKMGSTVGTAAYMSPEQLRGEAVDQRADIWSFGALLYEMVTGKLPFGDRPDQSLVLAILNEDPVPPTRNRPGIPPDLDLLILKCLDKDPARRFQSMDDVSRELKAGRIHKATSDLEKSIVVLPFDNLSPDPDNEYFADGLTEEIIADLSALESLRVISRTSAMQLKQTDKNVREIARLLDVQYVLEGSVRKAGNKLRITAQLIQAENDKHIWAEKYDGVLEDVFEIQEKVSRRIVEALKGHISPADQRQMAARPPFSSVGIYEAYSRAHYEFWKSEPESTERALRILEKAIGVFGEHPLLVSGIGAIHWQFYHQRGDLSDVHLAKVDECARKLFAGDPGSAAGHRLSSYLSLHAGNSVEAIRHLQRAMEGDPGDAETLLWLSYLLAVHAGRPAQAKPVAERWAAIDPLHPISKMSLQLVPWMNGDLESAVKGVEEWYGQDPEDQIRAFYLGHLLAWTGRHQESLRVAEKMVRQDPGDGMGRTMHFISLAVNGRTEEARKAIPSSMAESLWMDFHLPWPIAEGYALLGDRDEALRWLERAVERGIFNYPLLNELDPLLANVRGEERFQKLMEKVKPKWENFRA
jgi:serine/threonine protein kinase/Flp pilus assembly protein TadD